MIILLCPGMAQMKTVHLNLGTMECIVMILLLLGMILSATKEIMKIIVEKEVCEDEISIIAVLIIHTILKCLVKLMVIVNLWEWEIGPPYMTN